MKNQVDSFIAKYSPAIATQIRGARSRIRKRFPRGCELVYDNYNALVFGFAPGERASEAVLSVAAYPRWLTLFFLDGKKLRDPAKILQGNGARVRSVRLASPAQIDEPEIASLIEQALEPHREAFASAAPLKTLVKSVSARQRPRKPK